MSNLSADSKITNKHILDNVYDNEGDIFAYMAENNTTVRVTLLDGNFHKGEITHADKETLCVNTSTDSFTIIPKCNILSISIMPGALSGEKETQSYPYFQ